MNQQNPPQHSPAPDLDSSLSPAERSRSHKDRAGSVEEDRTGSSSVSVDPNQRRGYGEPSRPAD